LLGDKNASTASEERGDDPLHQLQEEVTRWRDLLSRQLSIEWELFTLTFRGMASHLAVLALFALALFGLYLSAVWLLLWSLGQMVSSFTESAPWFGHLIIGGGVCLVSFLGGGVLFSYQRRVALKRLYKRYEANKPRP
jgi:hypothetical protein